MSLPPFTQQLAQLIATPSVSSHNADWDMSNREVVHLLAIWLESLGFNCELIPVGGNIQTVAASPSDESLQNSVQKPVKQGISSSANKYNLIATKGVGPGGLVLAGHTDTVPYDEDRWQQDPFKLTEKEQRFYGLGATDMKGFFPVVIEALKAFRDVDFQQPLIVLATADEESSMNGARALAEQGYPKARYAVIGEPTCLKPIRMHKGMMMQEIRVTGLSGHSSNPMLGRSALETMHQVIAELLTFRREIQARYSHPGFDIQFPTMNLGCIHGGDNPNRICGQCSLQFDLRALPGMDSPALCEELTRRLQPLQESSGCGIEMITLFGGVEAFEQARQSALVAAAEKLCNCVSESVAFATEAPFLQRLGMETIVLGPGSIDQAHQPNEFIEQKQIKPAINIVESLIKQFCL